MLDEHGIAPDAVMLADALMGADDAEADAAVEGETGGVLGEDAGPDRPDAG